MLDILPVLARMQILIRNPRETALIVVALVALVSLSATFLFVASWVIKKREGDLMWVRIASMPEEEIPEQVQAALFQLEVLASVTSKHVKIRLAKILPLIRHTDKNAYAALKKIHRQNQRHNKRSELTFELEAVEVISHY